MRGAPLVTTTSESLKDPYTQVLGFMAFQFSPSRPAPENKWNKTEDLMSHVKRGGATICGAVIPSEKFKTEYRIVG